MSKENKVKVSRDTALVVEGEKHSTKTVQRPLPKKGEAKVYILTSAQNNTKLHSQCWRNLIAYAEYRKAEVLVATFTYNKQTIGAKNAKRKTSSEGSDNQREGWVPEIDPYIRDERIELAPGLVWCGELQILPTAVNPISGLESYTGRSSSIFPHPKFAVQSVPLPKHSGTKFLYTTGTVTLRNYIQKKAGQKAEFHHGYGALIVEVDSDGAWFVRQLCARTSDGSFYDFNDHVRNGKVSSGHGAEAIVWGDIHERQMEPAMAGLCFGKKGILDTLKPRAQIMHDLLDFRAQNHHDRDDSWKMFKKFCDKGLNIQTEVGDASRFLKKASRLWCETVVVCGNHDMALVRWLKEADFRTDPENALFFLRANEDVYQCIVSGNEAHPVRWAFRRCASFPANVRFLRRDESYVVCPKAGGVELGMHGDVGANGARANLRTFAKSGRKCVVGHSHSAAWFEGARQVGCLGSLDQGYNEGLSSWSHTNVIVYPNGKTALFTIWNGKWRAE